MVGSVTSAIAAAGYSWSISGKDRNGDGKITREEFDMPVAPGTTTLVPADLKSGGSLDDAFDAMDSNHDGVIDAKEAARPDWANHVGRPADRYAYGWNEYLSQSQADTYAAKVEKDNVALAAQWGLQI